MITKIISKKKWTRMQKIEFEGVVEGVGVHLVTAYALIFGHKCQKGLGGSAGPWKFPVRFWFGRIRLGETDTYTR